MAYLSEEELRNLGFKSLGKQVRVSDKASIYDADKMEIGDFSRIDDFCVVSGSVSIGKFVHVAPMCLVAGGVGGVTLDDFSGLAYGVKVFSQSDDYSGRSLTNPTVPKKYKKEKFSAVHIGRHVIVGTNAVVFPGVTLADGCAVGAMALVKHSTEPWGIYAGNPAKRVKERKRDLLELETQFLEELRHDSV